MIRNGYVVSHRGTNSSVRSRRLRFQSLRASHGLWLLQREHRYNTERMGPASAPINLYGWTLHFQFNMFHVARYSFFFFFQLFKKGKAYQLIGHRKTGSGPDMAESWSCTIKHMLLCQELKILSITGPVCISPLPSTRSLHTHSTKARLLIPPDALLSPAEMTANTMIC